MKLASEYGEQIHAGMGLTFQQDGDVFTIDFEADGLLDGGCVGLMGGLIEHRRETEEFAESWFVDDQLLMILIDGGHADFSRDQNVGLAAWIAHFVNTLARGKGF